jgi:hypothetical protein
MSDSKTVRTKGRLVATAREATFVPREDLAMLFVLADITEGCYTNAWLVPSIDVAAKTSGSLNQDRRRFSASVKPGTKDRRVGYRHTPATLPAEILRTHAEAAQVCSRAGSCSCSTGFMSANPCCACAEVRAGIAVTRCQSTCAPSRAGPRTRRPLTTMCARPLASSLRHWPCSSQEDTLKAPESRRRRLS